MHVFSNMVGLSGPLTALGAQHTLVPSGMDARSIFALVNKAQPGDIIGFNTDVSSVLWAAALQSRARIVAIDPVLPTPRSAAQRWAALVKKTVMRRVAHFVVYQQDLAGYARFYGISKARSTTVTFKVNSWARLDALSRSLSDDGAFVAAGRTNRDLVTFVAAAAQSGVRAVLRRQPAHVVSQHGLIEGRAISNGLVTEEIDEGGHAEFEQRLVRARAVVIPLPKDVINCAGISTALDAMAWGKPVIISESPATRGIIPSDAAMIVRPGDVNDMAEAMRRIDQDVPFRKGLGERAKDFALSLGGEERLLKDISQLLIQL